MDSSRNEKLHRVSKIVSVVLQVIFWFFIVFCAIYPTETVFVYLTMATLVIAVLALIVPFWIDHLGRKQRKRNS